uniref:cytochrome c oxidase subunit II n=1 Tax=Menacanthus cornutus TaxID=1491751 RepID=UPI00200191E7|nr:cytochrome c oxidase subunit II [Menacanthus cornutus]UNZ12989.1 cytochrome c oxidase subunit II [Menacanthus cornutus]
MNYQPNMSVQDPSSTIMEEIIFIHDHVMFFIIMILSVVFYFLLVIMTNEMVDKFATHQEKLEFFWTVLPAVILGLIALPSLGALYMSDEGFNPMLTVKVMGHQWYWSYEYVDFQGEMNFKSIDMDSYMINDGEQEDTFRLLDVDNRLILPVNTEVRVLVSSTDVIHSWAIPSAGVKVDAVPGRLNQTHLDLLRVGLYYGECSEMCGNLHSFMPTCIECVDEESFFNWMKED